MRVWTYATHSGRTSHGDLCGVFSNRAVDVFRCTLGMSRSGEDGAIVLGEDVSTRSRCRMHDPREVPERAQDPHTGTPLQAQRPVPRRA